MPGCVAEVMTVPLAVKELRPLRGAFGVLDREPLARHRQMEGQAGACLNSRRAALYNERSEPVRRAIYVPHQQPRWAR